MLVIHPKQVKTFLLVSVCTCGLATGFFAAQLAGYLLKPPPESTAAAGRVAAAGAPQQKDVDTALILNRNIFDPAARGREQEPVAPERPEPVRASAGGSLKLLGTVDGGDTPLALIESGGKVSIYRLGAGVPGGGELSSVERNAVVIARPDGSREKLEIVKPTVASSPSGDEADEEGGIRNLGDNRWLVSRDEVEKARSNLNELLKSAHMEPNIVDGRTEGFVVRMVRPRSLLAQLGIRRGDTVTRVNGVELNSPEKALQIFQQLREAKQLTVDLRRGEANLTFNYEVN